MIKWNKGDIALNKREYQTHSLRRKV